MTGSDLEDLKARLCPGELIANHAYLQYEAREIREMFAALTAQAAEIERLTREVEIHKGNSEDAYKKWNAALGAAERLTKEREDEVEDLCRSVAKNLQAYLNEREKRLSAETERDALKAENQRLREALEPFVRHANALLCEDGPMQVYTLRGYRNMPREDFERARAALQSGGE